MLASFAVSDRDAEHLQTIVVVGHMNPAIHHPGWYQSVGLFSEAEAKTAVGMLSGVSSELAQFRLDEIELLCLLDRWQLSAPAKCGERVLDLAAQTFKRLSETPVRAFGINDHFQVETGVADVSAWLAEMFLSLPLGLTSLGAASSGTIIVEHQAPKCVYRSTIGPSAKGPKFLSVVHNAHYLAPNEPRFDLDVLLHEAWSEAGSHARRLVSVVRDALG